MLCRITDEKVNNPHDTDAKEYDELEMRCGAEATVIQAILDNPIEALELYSGKQYEIRLNDLGRMMRADEPMFNALVTQCMKVKREQIEADIDIENS